MNFTIERCQSQNKRKARKSPGCVARINVKLWLRVRFLDSRPMRRSSIRRLMMSVIGAGQSAIRVLKLTLSFSLGRQDRGATALFKEVTSKRSVRFVHQRTGECLWSRRARWACSTPSKASFLESPANEGSGPLWRQLPISYRNFAQRNNATKSRRGSLERSLVRTSEETAFCDSRRTTASPPY
jgi:hypothetical protein